jgi:hypothetical protein
MMHQGRMASTMRANDPIAVIAIAGVIVFAGFAVIFFSPASSSATTEIRGSFISGGSWQGDHIVTNNASQYFPNGYQEAQVNLSPMRNGSVVALGSVKFVYFVPSTNPRPGVEVDYLCDSFFLVVLPNGSQFLLDHCTPFGSATRITTMTTTVQTGNGVGIELSTSGVPWSEWELSNNITPRVGIQVQGSGDNVTSVELAVAK